MILMCSNCWVRKVVNCCSIHTFSDHYTSLMQPEVWMLWLVKQFFNYFSHFYYTGSLTVFLHELSGLRATVSGRLYSCTIEKLRFPDSSILTVLLWKGPHVSIYTPHFVATSEIPIGAARTKAAVCFGECCPVQSSIYIGGYTWVLQGLSIYAVSTVILGYLQIGGVCLLLCQSSSLHWSEVIYRSDPISILLITWPWTTVYVRCLDILLSASC